MDCENEEETEKHIKEITDVITKVCELENYDCAVLCKYQDKAHKEIPMKIEPCTLHDIDEVWQWGDCKNGVDLMTDDNKEYLVFLTYGQSYQIKGEEIWHTVIEAFEILPYNKKRDFLNVVDYVLNKGSVKVAVNQLS